MWARQSQQPAPCCVCRLRYYLTLVGEGQHAGRHCDAWPPARAQARRLCAHCPAALSCPLPLPHSAALFVPSAGAGPLGSPNPRSTPPLPMPRAPPPRRLRLMQQTHEGGTNLPQAATLCVCVCVRVCVPCCRALPLHPDSPGACVSPCHLSALRHPPHRYLRPQPPEQTLLSCTIRPWYFCTACWRYPCCHTHFPQCA